MALMKSISGIRGTVGGKVDDNLTPVDIVKFTSAYGTWLKSKANSKKPKVVLGRDARISGEMYKQLVVGTLMSLGLDIIDLELSTTPTVELMVTELSAQGGIILTASHNPKQWNALKLLNEKGEFLSQKDGEEVLAIAAVQKFDFVEVDELGSLTSNTNAIKIHIEKILQLPLINAKAIQAKKWKVVVDAVNSTGGISVPPLLEALGVECIPIYCEPNGDFPHNPEPLPENLIDLSNKVKAEGADFGISVDPDVDRLALVCEDGSMFGEEYTLVAVADYILKHNPGATVSNLSSSRALADVTNSYQQNYFASAVGEVNVVEKMKAEKAVIGGEGNGGIIYPELHYGRDSLVGIALFLSHMAEKGVSCSALRDSYPAYKMMKSKIELSAEINPDKILENLKTAFSTEKTNTIDGLKIDFEHGWVHLRKSNTEPILRLYSEATSIEEAKRLVQLVKDRM